MTGIAAPKLLKTLLEKHAKDLCIPECKTGASWSGPKMRMLDLWVMKKSWSSPMVYGYEIKVNRNDFLRDEKWREYLGYCNSFFFVAPQGTIDPSELPPEAGLLIASKNGARLMTKKQAPYRGVQIPESLWRYVLMWRCKITKERGIDGKPALEWWKQFIEEKNEQKYVGHTAGWKIRNTVEKKVKAVMEENARLKRQNDDLESVKEFLGNHGLSLKSTYTLNHYLAGFVTEIKTGMPEGFGRWVSEAVRNLQQVETLIQERMKADADTTSS